MEARILKGSQAQFERALLKDAVDPGVEPFGTEVLVLMDQCAEQTIGGIHLPAERVGQMNMASESGVVVTIGSAAFAYYGDGSKWSGARPSVGDRVFVERYAGREILGRDGKTYRIMTYTSVAGRELPPLDAPTTSKKKG